MKYYLLILFFSTQFILFLSCSKDQHTDLNMCNIADSPNIEKLKRIFNLHTLEKININLTPRYMLLFKNGIDDPIQFVRSTRNMVSPIKSVTIKEFTYDDKGALIVFKEGKKGNLTKTIFEYDKESKVRIQKSEKEIREHIYSEDTLKSILRNGELFFNYLYEDNRIICNENNTKFIDKDNYVIREIQDSGSEYPNSFRDVSYVINSDGIMDSMDYNYYTNGDTSQITVKIQYNECGIMTGYTEVVDNNEAQEVIVKYIIRKNKKNQLRIEQRTSIGDQRIQTIKVTLDQNYNWILKRKYEYDEILYTTRREIEYIKNPTYNR